MYSKETEPTLLDLLLSRYLSHLTNKFTDDYALKNLPCTVGCLLWCRNR